MSLTDRGTGASLRAPYYSDPSATLYQGDCLDVLLEMEAESVHCVVTSPPYWGLRKYEGQQERVWGSAEGHEHEWGKQVEAAEHYTARTKWQHGADHRSNPEAWAREWASRGTGQPGSTVAQEEKKVADLSHGQFCSCGAWRGSFGLESLHDCLGWARRERCNVCYVCHSLTFLDAIWRVLRDDGVMFWNLGDNYASVGGHTTVEGDGRANRTIRAEMKGVYGPRIGLKHKDMVLIPQRIALAAQASGWWVRSLIVWAKLNPMPESVTDRPTSAYEHILMLTKSERYFWDQEAVRDPTGEWHEPGEHSRAFFDRDPAHLANGGKQNRRSKMPDGWDTGLGGHGSYHREGREDGAPSEIRTGRNMRDVWTIPTQPYHEAHFATFPEAIPDRCIRAATSEHGVCGACGAPWERVIAPAESVVGWQPTCRHETPVVPATVLDPFAGSGTTLAVAKRLGRHGVGIELSEDYCDLARKRIEAETARLL